ncbi:hypothetical protein [Saccharopolyspora rosea]|nr:hypothetical protein [Saccharopolyspora rosea]
MKMALIAVAVVVVLFFAAYGLMMLGIFWALENPEKYGWLH